MATRLVRFEFMCEKGRLEFKHPIPTNLLGPSAQGGPQFLQEFLKTLSPIMQEHEPECRKASNPLCGQDCGAPTQKVLLTPMSWLHVTDDPFVLAYVNPVCGKGECETKTRQLVQYFMEKMNREAPETTESGSPNTKKTIEILPCSICGQLEKTYRCVRCRTVAYCGKEHQKKHWPEHKGVCKKPMGTQ